MRLLKYHALGNDFLILLDLDDRHPVDGPTVRALCHRHRGVGADGFIRSVPAAPGRFRMTLFNADGGRAETSGNGLRCLARALADTGAVEGDTVTIETDAGPRRATLHADGTVTVEMGVARLGSQLAGDRPHLGVDVGNPHLVVLVEQLDALDLAREAAAHPGRNVEFVMSGPHPGEMTMRVWERGVGETQSCGSGSCAVAVAAITWGLAASPVTVRQPGGALTVAMGDDGALALSGPAERVADIEVGDG